MIKDTQFNEQLVSESKRFFEDVIYTLNERGLKFGNDENPDYHKSGIKLKNDRVQAGRVDRDTLKDLAAYAFLLWYFAGKHEDN